jgi:hypothetical protein
MTFKPVGESNTTIRIDGQNQGTWTQSDDSTYNIDTSVNVSTTESLLWDETVSDRDNIRAHLPTTDVTPPYVGEGLCDVRVTLGITEHPNTDYVNGGVVNVNIAGQTFDLNDFGGTQNPSGNSVWAYGVNLSNNTITVSGEVEEPYDSISPTISFRTRVWGQVPSGYSVNVNSVNQS